MEAQIGFAEGWAIADVSGGLPRYVLVFGLWKGDLTLKRAIRRIFGDLMRDGDIARILGRYGVSAAPAGSPAS